MTLDKLSARRAPRLATALLAAVCFARAADDAANAASPATASAQSPSDEIARLKAQLSAQQKQLDTLERMIAQQQQLLEKAVPGRPVLGSVASLAPVVPAPSPAPLAIPGPTPQKTATAAGNPCEAAEDTNAVPAYLRLGSTCVIPVGFMDLTGVWRNVNAGSGIGTN